MKKLILICLAVLVCSAVKAQSMDASEMEVVQEKLVLTHQISPLENPLQLRWSRRDVARLKTELRKRELQA